MFEGTTFGKTVDILHRTAGVAELRRRVIANNIANAETPNFKRSHISFEAELNRALASEKYQGLEARLTDERHIPFFRPISYKGVRPRKTLDYLTTSKNNGNNVDVEQEVMHSLENQMRYALIADSLRFQFRQINMVLTNY